MKGKKVTVSYWDFDGGRAEPIRVALYIGGIKFDDDRIPRPDWASRKANTLFGTIPEFVVEGKGKLAQSAAILRYVGKETGLYPTDSWDAARVDQILDATEDLTNKIVPSLLEKDENKKKEMREDLAKNSIPFYLGALEKLHKENGNGTYFVGNKLTIADLKQYYLMRWLASGQLDHIPKDIAASYTGLNALFKAVESNDKIKEYYAHRQKK